VAGFGGGLAKEKPPPTKNLPLDVVVGSEDLWIIGHQPITSQMMMFSRCPKVLSRSVRHHSRFFHATSSAQAKAKLTVTQLAERVNLKDKPVLVRVDLNVPLDAQDHVTDDTRLRAVLPTTNFLLERGAKVILCSHFGRPKGEIIEKGKNGRLTPVKEPLAKLLGTSVHKVNDCIGPEAEQAVADLPLGDVLLLENTRFHIGETKNDPVLAAGLGKLADYFVMDAFGTAHRAHSSTVGVTEHVKLSAAGFLLQKELDFLIGAMQDETKRPRMALVGGAKVSTKLPVLSSLMEKCDAILLGGAMIFTFFRAMGYETGQSMVEEDMVQMAADLIKQAEQMKVRLILPQDVVLADSFSNDASTAIAPVTELGGDWRGLDIGPETIETYQKILSEAKTVVWNGPMGVFEMSNFATGTMAMAETLADLTVNKGLVSIVGGGDSVAAVQPVADKISHISTGGGASLELLEGKVLPGVAALSDA
jgi:phosphoglycerate kinase